MLNKLTIVQPIFNAVRYTFIIIFSFICHLSNGQYNTDSLLNQLKQQGEDTLKVNTLNALYNAFLYNDPQVAKQYAFQELELARKLNYEMGIGQALYHLGAYYSNHDNIDSALYYYHAAEKQFEQMNSLKSLTSIYHGLAIINYSRGEYDSALAILDRNIELYQTQVNDSGGLAISYDMKGGIELFRGNYRIAMNESLKALKILNRIDKPIRKADALNRLASIEFYLNNYEKSLEYNQEALEIYKQYDDRYYQSQVYNDIGNTYYYTKEYERGIENLNQSIELSRELKIPELELTALNNLGKTYQALELYDEAMINLRKALAMAESNDNPNKLVEGLCNMADCYVETNKPALAVPLLNRAVKLAEDIGVKENLRIAYFTRYEANEKLGDISAALADYKQYAILSDSLLSENKSRQIEEMRAIYDTENKEQQITIQEQEIELLNQQARSDNLQRILLAVGLLLSLVLLYGIYQKLKRKKAEKEKVDTELAFKKKELTTKALHLAKKNEVLEELKQQVQELRKQGDGQNGYNKLIKTIDFDLNEDKNWENFARSFEEIHKDFNKNVKQHYPDVTSNELRLMALLKMNLTSKEIANILNVSAEGIKKARYRLRKKLSLESDKSLQDMVINL